MIRLENNYIIAQYWLKTAIHQWKSQIFWIWVFLEISAFDLYSLLPGSLIYHKIWQIISTSGHEPLTLWMLERWMWETGDVSCTCGLWFYVFWNYFYTRKVIFIQLKEFTTPPMGKFCPKTGIFGWKIYFQPFLDHIMAKNFGNFPLRGDQGNPRIGLQGSKQRWTNTVFWTEYEYEYYSESEFRPNTNTNNIRFFKMSEYEYE